MTLKHTPGPWSLVVSSPIEGSTFCTLSLIGANKKYILPLRKVENCAEQIANLNIMAAAPELLEALEELIGDRYYPARENDPVFINAREKARYVIAKAKGE